MKRWEGKIGERAKLSPIVLAGGVEFGQANRFVHIWAYKSMNQRLEVREQARKAGVWPPPGGGDELLAQTNKLMMPSSFSPLQYRGTIRLEGIDGIPSRLSPWEPPMARDPRFVIGRHAADALVMTRPLRVTGVIWILLALLGLTPRSAAAAETIRIGYLGP